ncbi:hypothetical protein MLD38_040011 [Melastoma candidum]|uniref:Uncharacterized protein n=1 Tax=Melastoma candidum TaxID=119954 RepID=A0ACB9L4P2_9MYRT|nr:hypothetical protein MLD38_040011 [Melastoma candidum]
MAITGDGIENLQNQHEEGMTEPLLLVEEGGKKGDARGVGKGGNPWMIYFCTFVAVCGSYEFGACTGYSSPTQTAIREDLNLSLSEYSVFGSILTFGAMIGAITSGPIADSIGRKWTLRVAAAFCVAGWLAIYFAEGAIALDIGRLSSGYGMGAFSYVVPVFVAEMAPKNRRGVLTAFNQLMICAGGSVVFIIGTVLSWRALALTCLIPCAVLLLGLFFIPESPRWLAKTGQDKEFEAVLQKLRGEDADVSDEAAEIQDYIETLERLPKAKLLDLFRKRYRHSVTDENNWSMACHSHSSGFSSTVGTITYAILQVVITAIGAVLVDQAGRKPLLLISGSGIVAACLLVAVSFFLKAHDWATTVSPILAVAGILLYVGSFSVGMGAVPWVVMAEIFPVNIKGVAGGFATLVNWFGAWLISYTFNYLMSWSSYGTFILYAAINLLGIVFIALVVPETKGRSLEQIQAAINKDTA